MRYWNKNGVMKKKGIKMCNKIQVDLEKYYKGAKGLEVQEIDWIVHSAAHFAGSFQSLFDGSEPKQSQEERNDLQPS